MPIVYSSHEWFSQKSLDLGRNFVQKVQARRWKKLEVAVVTWSVGVLGEFFDTEKIIKICGRIT